MNPLEPTLPLLLNNKSKPAFRTQKEIKNFCNFETCRNKIIKELKFLQNKNIKTLQDMKVEHIIDMLYGNIHFSLITGKIWITEFQEQIKFNDFKATAKPFYWENERVAMIPSIVDFCPCYENSMARVFFGNNYIHLSGEDDFEYYFTIDSKEHYLFWKILQEYDNIITHKFIDKLMNFDQEKLKFKIKGF
jgi:hypothetical protein